MSARSTPRREEGSPRPIEDAPSRQHEAALPPELDRYTRTPVRWRPGCEVGLLVDGARTYHAMLDAIAKAERSILVETYTLAADTTGDRFKVALIARARAGVAVRILYDAVGSFALPDAWIADLRAAGVAVVEFNPIAPWRRRFNLSHRDHRKILVVDDEVAFTGGLNIADDYASVYEGGAGWRDMHCELRGPIVRDLSRLFRRSWLRSGGEPYPAPPRSGSSGEGRSFVRLLENTALRHRARFRRAYLHVIKAARTSVRIHNAYFLPDRGIRRALVRAVRRGVDVQVIVPGRSDVKLVEWASHYVLRALARRGVKIWRWRGPMMHAKCAVIDQAWSTIGSYNFDAQSRFNNLEVTVEILDPTIGSELAGAFQADRANCDAYDEATWRALPFWQKALAWIGYRLRRLL